MARPLTAWQQGMKAYFYVTIWMTISMGVILFNKVRPHHPTSPPPNTDTYPLILNVPSSSHPSQYILAYSGFKYPIALTLWHMVFCTTVATIMVKVVGATKSLNMPRKEYVNRVVPI